MTESQQHIISMENVTYTYPGVEQPALQNLSFQIEEGEFLLVAGASGSGKSTMLRLLNGLVPHFHGGVLSGDINVAGRNPVLVGPGEMSDAVGFVFQDPEAQFVAEIVEDEIAFALENAGLPMLTMRKRVEEGLDALSIGHLRGRRVNTLSGGERQRVAIAAVLALHPRVLVLDEPTSQLDPQSAEEVLDALVKLNKDLGLTIILSEHRLERVVQHADRILYLERGTAPIIGEPRLVLAEIPLAPPLAQVGKLLGWSPLPLTIKEGRKFAAISPVGAHGRAPLPHPAVLGQDNAPVGARHASPLPHPGTIGQDSASMSPVGAHGRAPLPHPGVIGQDNASVGARHASPLPHPGVIGQNDATHTAITLQNLWFGYGSREIFHGLDLRISTGEITAIMGRNGTGKTTLLKLVMGLLKPQRGTVSTLGTDTRSASLDTMCKPVGYVPQQPDVLLFADTVQAEIDFTRRAHHLPPDGAELLASLGLTPYRDADPRDLSVGERQRVALAAVLAAQPQALLLDEPTRGLDYLQKQALAEILRSLRTDGRTVVLATHDVELAAQLADRVILLGDGEIIADGPAREVMSGSLVFSSQVSKLFRDPALVTVDDVRQLQVGRLEG